MIERALDLSLPLITDQNLLRKMESAKNNFMVTDDFESIIERTFNQNLPVITDQNLLREIELTKNNLHKSFVKSSYSLYMGYVMYEVMILESKRPERFQRK